MDSYQEPGKRQPFRRKEKSGKSATKKLPFAGLRKHKQFLTIADSVRFTSFYFNYLNYLIGKVNN